MARLQTLDFDVLAVDENDLQLCAVDMMAILVRPLLLSYPALGPFLASTWFPWLLCLAIHVTPVLDVCLLCTGFADKSDPGHAEVAPFRAKCVCALPRQCVPQLQARCVRHARVFRHAADQRSHCRCCSICAVTVRTIEYPCSNWTPLYSLRLAYSTFLTLFPFVVSQLVCPLSNTLRCSWRRCVTMWTILESTTPTR